MTIHGLLKALSATLLASVFALSAQAALTDISTDPLNTYSAPSSTDVKPNVLFVLDDSGSMNWDFMPDWACASNSATNSACSSTGEDPSSTRAEALFRNSAYNGVYYNPATTYVTPVFFDADGSRNTTTYPSQTSANTSAWTVVKNDAYGVQFSGTTDLTTRSKYFYTFVAGEWCNSTRLTACQASQTSTYAIPASLRWCNSSANSTAASPAANSCQAAFNSTTGYAFTWARAPSPNLATITVAGTSSTTLVSSVKVNNKEILFAAAAASNSANTIAAAIAASINKCTLAAAGNCQVSGYTAYAASGVVTVAAPLGANITYTPVVTKSGTMSVSPAAFAVGTVPGASLLTVINPDRDSYPFPGTATKAATRTDCAGTTCSYAEEMTNYANWWAYYRTRMQTMKSATSNAFSTMDSATDVTNNVSRFRVGYMSINNNTDADFLNLDEFKTTQKNDWYTKLFAASPSNSTPLRHALSTAGRLYGGRLNGATLNGSIVTDPLQFSCQQNYTILSTDGYWNESSSTVVKLNGSTEVGNQDGGLPPPYNDGGSATIQAKTSSLQSQTSTLKAQTNQLQQRTSTLEQRRSNDSGGTWYQDWTAVSSCIPDGSSSTRTQCRYTAWTGWSDTATCTTANQDTSGTWSVGTARQCQWAGWTDWTPVAACTAITQDTSSPYNGNLASNGLARNCATSVTMGYANVGSGGSCTVTTVPDANGVTTQCRYTDWSSWTTVSACSALAQSSSPNYTAVTATQCQTLTSAGTTNTLADVAAYYYGKDLRDAAAINPDATGTCTGPVIAPATIANDLCANTVPPNGLDVAQTQHMTTFTLGLGAQGLMAYSPTYQSDQSGDFYDVKTGAAAGGTSGICSWMASGTCTWPQPSSNNQTTIDDLWHAAVNGRGSYFSAKDPASLSTGLADTLAAIVNTPRPGTAAAAASSNPNISSSDNYVFSSSYKSVEWFGELIRQQIDSAGVLSTQQWSAMRLLDCATTVWTATTSYPVGSVFRNGTTCYAVTTEYVSGTAFGSTDTTNTAVVNDPSGSPVVAQTTRTLYTKGASALIPFQWANLVAASLSSNFTTPAITYDESSGSGLSQFCTSGTTCLNATLQSNNTVATGGAAGEALVNFLRGERSNETTFYRQRTHVLGDIVSSEGRYVKVPIFNYSDAHYDEFKAAKASRAGKVYVSANDGMLHAFDAESGEESWGYIPSFVLPNLYKLADMNYNTHHQYSVDNSPETGDICPNAPTSTCSASQWKTILVGGLNRGGKGYFALDITDPASPALLWEFTDANLGYTYGNPRITKLADGTWVVIVSSGHNNADGVGRLYVLNANTGALIRTISTGVGNASTPSGLARISAHSATADTNNTTDAVYGGDLLGNLWRFDINNTIAPSGYDATLLVSFTDAAGNPQPITAKPTTATINGKTVVFVGTGRYLGISDLTNTQVESFYAVKDNSTATTLGNPRVSASNFVGQTLTSGSCPANAPTSWCIPGQSVRTSTSNAVDWDLKNGWYVDFVTGGERSVTDSALAFGTLLFTTIYPNNSTANACGTETADASASYLYALDYKTGAAVQGTLGVSGVSLGNVIATRPIVLKINGSIRYLIRTSRSGGGQGTDMGGSTGGVVPTAPGGGPTRRVSWRELLNE